MFSKFMHFFFFSEYIFSMNFPNTSQPSRFQKCFCTNISFSFQYFSMSFCKYLHDASCVPSFWVI